MPCSSRKRFSMAFQRWFCGNVHAERLCRLRGQAMPLLGRLGTLLVQLSDTWVRLHRGGLLGALLRSLSVLPQTIPGDLSPVASCARASDGFRDLCEKQEPTSCVVYCVHELPIHFADTQRSDSLRVVNPTRNLTTVSRQPISRTLPPPPEQC